MKAIKAFLPTAEAISRLLYPFAEVVIHDIKKNQIVAIFNPLSKRKVGSPSLLAEEQQMINLEDCIGPYEKRNWDGKKLKSVSSLIRDENNKAVAMLCINLDVSQFHKFSNLLTSFLNCESLIPQPTPLFKDDWQEKINHFVHTYLNENHLTIESLSREQKKRLVEHLYQSGAFTGKNAAQYIAEIFNISRATVYNYLAQFQE